MSGNQSFTLVDGPIAAEIDDGFVLDTLHEGMS
jgi:hypothetical protein